MKSLVLPLLSLVIAAFSFEAVAAPKYKRALVIAGGGISPGIALGLIAGARDSGYNPDVIVAVCGASLGSSISVAHSSPEAALEFAKSQHFYEVVQSLAQLDDNWALAHKFRLDAAEENPEVIPPVFHDNILVIPDRLSGVLPREKFPTSGTRLVILATKSSLSPENVGGPWPAGPTFEQVFFTDPETAHELKGFRSPIAKLFPHSHMARQTETITGVRTVQAARASVSDPFFINPPLIGSHYYFTGASNLYPIEAAQQLAEEVLVTYPNGAFDRFESITIKSTFGFDPNEASRAAVRHNRVKWIDVTGMGELIFNPQPWGLFMVSRIPNSLAEYQAGIDRQYSFGYERAVEAVRLQRKIGNVRTHIRQPFN